MLAVLKQVTVPIYNKRCKGINTWTVKGLIIYILKQTFNFLCPEYFQAISHN